MSFFNRENLQKLSLILFFILIPYKVVGIFQLEPLYRLLIGFLSFLLCLKFLDQWVSWFLNLPIVQLSFFYMLCVENYLREEKPIWFQIFLCSCLGFNLGAWPNLSSDPLFWYLLIGFFLSFYSNMQRFFLNPEIEGNIYISNKDLDLENLSWEQIHKNMEHICLILFKTPLTNQLGSALGKKVFSQISKRYVWSRISGTFRRNADLISAGTGIAGLFGIGITNWINLNQHNEQMAKQQEANDIARMQAEAARRQAEAARRQAEAAEEANAIAREQQEKLRQEAIDIAKKKAKELDPYHTPKSKGWLWDSFEDSFSHNIVKIFSSFF